VTARLGGPKDESETGNENDSEGSNETTREASSGNSGNGNPEGEASKPKEVVFIVDESLAKMIQVETGISDDKYIQIKSGLEEGQQVISGPYRAISKELEEDVKVSVEKKGNRFQKSGS
jgi:HlyD family secretion protein